LKLEIEEEEKWEKNLGETVVLIPPGGALSISQTKACPCQMGEFICGRGSKHRQDSPWPPSKMARPVYLQARSCEVESRMGKEQSSLDVVGNPPVPCVAHAPDQP